MADGSADPSPVADNATGAGDPLASIKGPLAELARLIERDQAVANSAHAQAQPHIAPPADEADEVPPLYVEPEKSTPAPDRPDAQASGTFGPVSGVGDPIADGVRAQERAAPQLSDWDYTSAIEHFQEPQRQHRGKLKTLLGLALAGCAGAFGHWLWSQEMTGKGAPLVSEAAAPIGHRDESGRSQWTKQVQKQFDELEPPALRPRQMFPLDGGVLYATQTAPSAEQRMALEATAESRTRRAGIAPADEVVKPGTGQPQRATPSPRTGSGPPGKQAPRRAKQELPSPTAPVPRTPSEQNTAASSEGAAAPVGSYVVQLSLHRSEEAAQAAARDTRTNYPDVFEDRQPVVVRTDLGEKGVFYRAEVGPFINIEQASQFCSSLR